jgi:ParB family chromosome partitioning protein
VNQHARYKQVHPRDIDLSDNSYNLSPFITLHELRAAAHCDPVQLILHPPLLLEQQNSYTILAGAECIPEQSAIRQDSLTAIVVEKAVAENHKYLFSLLLRYRSLHSPLSLLEQAVFLQKASAVLPRREIIELLPLLGYAKKSFFIDDLQALLKLDHSTQKALHEGLIPLRCARKIDAFSPADQKRITELITTFRLGGSKQQKLVDLLLDLTKRLQCDCRKLLGDWQDEIQERELNGPQKAASLLTHLEKLCAPRSQAAEDEFVRFRKTLRLPPSVQLHHTLAFENDRLTLSIDFSSRKELAEYWPAIREITTGSRKS